MLQNNEPSWLQIWERKGREAAGKPEYGIAELLTANGRPTEPPGPERAALLKAED